MRAFLLVLAPGLSAATASSAEIHLRWNRAGFAANAPKVFAALSDTDLGGREWFVYRDTVVLRGNFGPSVTAAGDHTPFAFNHAADVGALTEPGEYEFITPGASPAKFTIEASPYERLLPFPLRDLRLQRSGSYHTLLREYSHPGDARAPQWVPAGDPAEGRWVPREPARTLDVLGGWYDGSDQIKFTLTTARTTYLLLYAYRLQPALFVKQRSHTELPDVLDEAKHGLDFLMRVHPDDDTFVIQVGNADDHRQAPRLPEKDPLDGQRPALCALSRAHMGAAAAALAIGARTFAELGQSEEAARYGAMARKIYARARQADTMPTAFERDGASDLYRDPDPNDQLAVAALELNALTGEARYLEEATAYTPPAATTVGWANWNAMANAMLAPHDPAARERLGQELAAYVKHAAAQGAPWHVPSGYTARTLPDWIGKANVGRLYGGARITYELFWSVADYVFGRNNWGVSFLCDERLPNTARHLANPTYRLLHRFPSGALAAGPVSRGTHDAAAASFHLALDDPLRRFNTGAGVFFDEDTDALCMEATISGQAEAVLLLTLACRDSAKR